MTDALTAQAVETEIVRIVRAASQVTTYQRETLQTYGYRILVQSVPGFTRERWEDLLGKSQRTAAQARQADRDLLRQHGRLTCCPACDANAAHRLRAELGQHTGPDLDPPEADEDEDEDEDECAHNSVTCAQCDGPPGCDGIDRWGDPSGCDNSCENCDECEFEHRCRSCGLIPDCAHEWQCGDCDQGVQWTGDHWEEI